LRLSLELADLVGHWLAMLHTIVGLAAAICTTLSYVPQLKKCWQTGETDDLSLRMLLVLTTGITLWIVYGFMGADIVIILANSISVMLLIGLLYFKLKPKTAK
jgi:MtN3 and saliva related transmembrane protein